MEQNHQDITAKNKQPINGTLIYQPKGPAGEYAKWAINLYNGCSNGCEYCYNRRGVLSHAFGDEPKLAAPIEHRWNDSIRADILYRKEMGLPDQSDAEGQEFVQRLKKDVIENTIWEDVKKIGLEQLRADGGVFFSFKSDPMSKQTLLWNFLAIIQLLRYGIPVTVLTKNIYGLDSDLWTELLKLYNSLERMHMGELTIGITITGMDDMEPRSPSTEERINALRRLNDEYNIKTFVSLEPVVDIKRATDVLDQVITITDEVRVGCLSPLKRDRYEPEDFQKFVRLLYSYHQQHSDYGSAKVFAKNSMVRQAMLINDYDVKLECASLLSWIKRDSYDIIGTDDKLFRDVYGYTYEQYLQVTNSRIVNPSKTDR